jgi:hypothetical protein
MMEICLRDLMFSYCVLFLGKASFCLNGTVNRHNWARENPHWMQEIHSQYPQKVDVCAGMIDDRILDPFPFANNLTGNRYLQLLQLESMPALAALFPNANNPDLQSNTIRVLEN